MSENFIRVGITADIHKPSNFSCKYFSTLQAGEHSPNKYKIKLSEERYKYSRSTFILDLLSSQLFKRNIRTERNGRENKPRDVYSFPHGNVLSKTKIFEKYITKRKSLHQQFFVFLRLNNYDFFPYLHKIQMIRNDQGKCQQNIDFSKKGISIT